MAVSMVGMVKVYDVGSCRDEAQAATRIEHSYFFSGEMKIERISNELTHRGSNCSSM